jgi:hypothetical protein
MKYNFKSSYAYLLALSLLFSSIAAEQTNWNKEFLNKSSKDDIPGMLNALYQGANPNTEYDQYKLLTFTCFPEDRMSLLLSTIKKFSWSKERLPDLERVILYMIRHLGTGPNAMKTAQKAYKAIQCLVKTQGWTYYTKIFEELEKVIKAGGS